MKSIYRLDGWRSMRHCSAAVIVYLIFLFLVLVRAEGGEPATKLWQLGKPDKDNREFALAPSRYSEFRQDALYVVGQSDPKREWPYVQPGPVDGWAGGKEHTFAVLFGVKNPPASGECRLAIELVDTQHQAPPKVRLNLNGRPVVHSLPAGAGDASIFGEPSRGKSYRFETTWPAQALKAGANEVTITTLSGSWLLYDCLTFQAPAGTELSDISPGTTLSPATAPPVLVQRDGKLMQPVRVPLRHFGKETEARFRLQNQAAVTQPLHPGPQDIELLVPAVKQETSLSLEVEVAGQVIAQQSVQLKPVRQWVVYLLPHSHVDIGYTHVQTDVERAQWKYLETAIETARRTAGNPPGARFKWNVEVLWAVDSYLRQASAEKQQQFVQAVQSGWVGLQALYGNELTGLCRPEELLRLVSYAQKLSERVGQPITSAMITDVPGYTWGVVPAFAQSGIKYFSIGPNGGDRIGHTIAAWGDKPFWWIGPNGRDKILVWMTGTGYYQVFQSPDKLLDYLGQLDAKGYPYDYVQVRHCLGDNGAPDVSFAGKVNAWNDTHAFPKLVIATSEEMFKDFERRYGNQIPVAKGDFTPYWEDGAASSARETALNRASADRLTQAETVFALLNPGAYPAEAFYQAWRNVVLYDEHTWGAHNSISEPDAPFVKSQWAIKQSFALEADGQSRQLLAAALESRPSANLVSNAIDVLNTSSAGRRHGLVIVPKELSTAGDTIRTSPESASVLPSQRLTSGELAVAAALAPYSLARFYFGNPASPAVSTDGAQAEGCSLTLPSSDKTQGIQLRLDEKTGAIASLRYAGHELVDSHASTALNDYFYLPGSDVNRLERHGPVKISVKERGPLIASLLVESEAPGCRRLTREIRLHAPEGLVEIINTLDKLPVRTKEGVHFGFGFNVPSATIRMDVPWALVRPEADQIPGACKNWFTVQRWVDVANREYGVTWLTPDAPLVEIGNITANLIGSLPDPKRWLEHIAPSPTIYSWAMNNHWHTNYRAEQEGPTVFRYLIYPHGPFQVQEAVRHGTESSQPLLVTAARGNLPKTPGLRLSNSNVLVTALKPSEDGKGLVLRLFGASDQQEEVDLDWGSPTPSAVWLSDTGEHFVRKVNGKIEVPQYSIVTVRTGSP